VFYVICNSRWTVGFVICVCRVCYLGWSEWVMTKTCWAPGCKSGYRSSSGTDCSRHFFAVPASKCKEWNRRIPRDCVLTEKHYICDLHFEPHFIVKSDSQASNRNRASNQQKHKLSKLTWYCWCECFAWVCLRCTCLRSRYAHQDPHILVLIVIIVLLL
jgi:THAP domain